MEADCQEARRLQDGILPVIHPCTCLSPLSLAAMQSRISFSIMMCGAFPCGLPPVSALKLWSNVGLVFGKNSPPVSALLRGQRECHLNLSCLEEAFYSPSGVGVLDADSDWIRECLNFCAPRKSALEAFFTELTPRLSSFFLTTSILKQLDLLIARELRTQAALPSMTFSTITLNTY